MAKEKELLSYFIRINSISGNRKLSFDQRLQGILDEILSCLRVKSGSIMVRTGRRYLEVRAASSPGLIGVRQNLKEDSVSAWVARSRKPVYISDLVQDGRFRQKYDHYQRSALLSVPLLSDGKTVGVLNVTDRMENEDFSPEERQSLFDMAGQVISALERQRLMEDLQKKERMLQKKNCQLRKEEQLRTDLFNMLVHDLKGPISEIVANLDILSYTVDTENKDFVESAQTGCYTLLRMVGNLLDIAKLERGRIELLCEKIDEKDLIRETVARLFGLAKIKELTFSEEFPDTQSEEELWADRSMLLRILQNLLSNAIEYSPAKGVLTLGYSYSKPLCVEFFVKDQGPGIAPENHEKIFDKYTQLERKTDGRIYTTGLGLAFCKVATRAHGGKIGVQSRKGEGSRFYFNLPLGRKTCRKRTGRLSDLGLAQK